MNKDAKRKECEKLDKGKCTVITFGQKCADWLVSRQLRVIGINASLKLS